MAPNPAAYTSFATIQEWVDDFDVPAIEAHAWGLWGALNAPSGQYHQQGGVKEEVALWETWFDEFETFHLESECPEGDDCTGAMRLHGPRQQPHGSAQVLSFNQ